MSSSRQATLRARRETRAGYHHGDLRRALLDAALRSIEQHGPEGFTLRAAAREAGVSAGAPYHHFEDKDALVAALAEEGFERLYAALDAAGAAPVASPRERSDAMAATYVRFAVEHPTYFRLMMGRDVRALRHRTLARAAQSAYELMRGAVVKKMTGRADAHVPDEIVLGSWAIVHGLAFLAIDGHLAGPSPSWARCEPVVNRLLSLPWLPEF